LSSWRIYHRTGLPELLKEIGGYVLEWNRAENLQAFQLSLSIGVSEGSHGMTLDQMLDEAD